MLATAERVPKERHGIVATFHNAPVSLSSSYLTFDLAGISMTACTSPGAFSPISRSCQGCEEACCAAGLQHKTPHNERQIKSHR